MSPASKTFAVKSMAASNAPPSALSPSQTYTLSHIVTRLRTVLPDPTARDIYDTIAENDEAMTTWATASRVKKLNTSMNKVTKSETYVRDGCEPDETSGPIVLDELQKWPSETSVFLNLAAQGHTRIFKASEHHKKVDGEGDDEDDANHDEEKTELKNKIAGLRFRQSLVAAGKLFDEKILMWKLGSESDDDTNELVIVCNAVKQWRSESDKKENKNRHRAVFDVSFTFGEKEKNAHKRVLAPKLTEHAGGIGELSVTKKTLHTWLTHLKRNMHYADKYGGTLGDGFWDDVLEGERGDDDDVGKKMSEIDIGNGNATAQTWQSSYLVTPSPEWFR